MNGLRNDKWFMKGYDPVQPLEENTDEPNDVAAVFGDNEVWRPPEASNPAVKCIRQSRQIKLQMPFCHLNIREPLPGDCCVKQSPRPQRAA